MKLTMAVLFMFAASVSAASAETYSWTDAQGTMHFAEDLGAVPAKLRKKVKRLGGDEPAAPAAAVKTETQMSSPKSPSGAAAGKGEPQTAETYAGKTYDQWKAELAVREDAMSSVRKRIDEIVALVKNPTRKVEQQKLIDEHTALVKQFKEMRSDYDRQVEAVRKAGLQVNIQQ